MHLAAPLLDPEMQIYIRHDPGALKKQWNLKIKSSKYTIKAWLGR